MVVAGLLAACQHADAQSTTAEEPPVFEVAAPAISNTSYEREFVGRVQAVRYARIRTRVKGIIASMALDEGASVKADQLLFSIRAGEQQQELLKAKAVTAAAEADLKLARLERQNTRMLFDKEVVSGAEMTLADAKVDVLAAKLEQAKAERSQASIALSYTQIRAPFAGVVNRIPHKVGSIVGEEDELTTIADATEVFVYFHMSEREYLEHMAQRGGDRPQEVSLRLADGALHPHAGVVDSVENEVDVDTGNIALRARFANPDGTLKHGSSGKVVIRTEVPDAVLVAQKSTFEVQGRLYVYVVDAEGVARAREIVSRVRLKETFVVAEGVGSEDRIVVEGVQKLTDGVRIRTAPAT